MSRIDVVANGRDYKVMLNFIQSGTSHKSQKIANLEAKRLQEKYPHAQLNLMEEVEEKA